MWHYSWYCDIVTFFRTLWHKLWYCEFISDILTLFVILWHYFDMWHVLWHCGIILDLVTLFVTLWYLLYCDILISAHCQPVSSTLHCCQFDDWGKFSNQRRNVDHQTSTENINLNLLFATGNSYLWHCGPLHTEGQGTVQREEVPAGGGRWCLQGNFIIIVAPWLVLNWTR